jgi:hypothetical protein
LEISFPLAIGRKRKISVNGKSRERILKKRQPMNLSPENLPFFREEDFFGVHV